MDEHEILDNPSNQKENNFNYKPYAAWLWASFFLLGIGFRLLHWVGGSILLVISLGGMIAYNLSSYMRAKGKNQLNTIFSIICIILLLVFLYGAMFNGGYPVNYRGLMVMGSAFILTFGIQELVFRLQGK